MNVLTWAGQAMYQHLFQMYISDFELARKILTLEGKSSCNLGIINSLIPAYRGKGLAKRINDSMEMLAHNGYGAYVQSRFYKNPHLPAETLMRYGLTRPEYQKQYAIINTKSSHFLRSERLRLGEILHLESLLFQVKHLGLDDQGGFEHDVTSLPNSTSNGS